MQFKKFRRKEMRTTVCYIIVLCILLIEMTSAARRQHRNGTWIRMGMIVDEMMQNDQGMPSCRTLPGLSTGQTRLCQLYMDHMNAVALGAKQALGECKHQFHNRRWNCSLLEDDANVFGPVITIGKDETFPSV
nr:unnamed protein product [Callosobruchus chinensis]